MSKDRRVGGRQGDGNGGDGDEPSTDLVPVSRGIGLTKALMAMIRALGVGVTAQASEALEHGLHVATTGRNRVVVFWLGIVVGVVLTFLALEAAARAGYMLGLPIYLFIVFFVPIVFAMILTAIPVLFTRLSTPETEQALDLSEWARLQYQAVRALEAELRKSGLAEKEILDQVVPLKLAIGTEELKKLRKIAGGAPAQQKAAAKAKAAKAATSQIVPSTDDGGVEKGSAQAPVPDDSKDAAPPDSNVR